MDNNKLLTNLFPDVTVRNIIQKVTQNDGGFAEPMRTNYSFLDAEMNTLYTSSGQPCFGQLFRTWRETGTKGKYLNFLPKYSDKCKKATRLRWIELGQEMDILPDDITPKDLIANGITIDMTNPELTLGELYLQLTYMRWLREAPILVNNIITLVDDAGRDFWAAACYCHEVNMSRIDHSLLPFKKGYPCGGHRKDANRDLGIVMRMHLISVSPRTADKRTVVKHTAENKGFYWKWQATVTKPKRNLIVKDRLMLLSSELHPLIYSGDVDKAAEMIKTLKMRKSHVQFEE